MNTYRVWGRVTRWGKFCDCLTSLRAQMHNQSIPHFLFIDTSHETLMATSPGCHLKMQHKSERQKHASDRQYNSSCTKGLLMLSHFSGSWVLLWDPGCKVKPDLLCHRNLNSLLDSFAYDSHKYYKQTSHGHQCPATTIRAERDHVFAILFFAFA